MDTKRVGTGEFDFTLVESGRNFSQAHDKAMPKIKEEINQSENPNKEGNNHSINWIDRNSIYSDVFQSM